MRTFMRVASVLGLLLASSVFAVARPAWACGCGAVIADSSVRISEETSIVRYDAAARTEEIVMRLSAESSAADAAWLFPTPPAASVRLGERGWFEQLDALTEPRVVTRKVWFPGLGGGGAAPSGPGGSVGVLGERDLGPFRVATLEAGDPGALADWLTANGYRLRPDLERALDPYVVQGWKYVAVKLRPSSGAPLNGDLEPLRVSFSSDELVYPMRLSRLAKDAQRLHLYVLGRHRVEQSTGARMRVAFAGQVAPEQVRSPRLREFLGDGLFMTELVDGRIDPEEIVDDYRFTAAGNRQVVHREEVVRLLGAPAGWLIVFAAGALAVALGTVIPVRLRSRAT